MKKTLLLIILSIFTCVSFADNYKISQYDAILASPNNDSIVVLSRSGKVSVTDIDNSAKSALIKSFEVNKNGPLYAAVKEVQVTSIVKWQEGYKAVSDNGDIYIFTSH